MPSESRIHQSSATSVLAFPERGVWLVANDNCISWPGRNGVEPKAGFFVGITPTRYVLDRWNSVIHMFVFASIFEMPCLHRAKKRFRCLPCLIVDNGGDAAEGSVGSRQGSGLEGSGHQRRGVCSYGESCPFVPGFQGVWASKDQSYMSGQSRWPYEMSSIK